VRTFFGKGGRGSSDADVRTFGAKNIGFFEIYGAFALTRGFEPVRTFFGQGGGRSIFAIFYGRLLWTGPYLNFMHGPSQLTLQMHPNFCKLTNFRPNIRQKFYFCCCNSTPDPLASGGWGVGTSLPDSQ